MSSETEKPIIDTLETDKPHSVCVMVSQDECQEDKKTEIKDLKDNAGSVVIRIEPAATTETDSQNTDSLNSKNSCEKHRGEEQSLSSTESDHTTNSLSSEEDDGAGLANPAFVEDDELEEGKKKKKCHHRRPSCSPNKDIECISGVAVGGSGGDGHLPNPPIMTDVTDMSKKGDDEKSEKSDAYSEYFMPNTEYKTQIGGDYEKTKKEPTAAKIFCWIISSLLLTGAVILAVLIGTGIIDTDPTKHIKVSRKLSPENVSRAGPGHLMEVRLENAPNVLTNDPDFFSHKKEVGYFDGEFKITNLGWNSDFQDSTTFQYQQLADILETELNSLLDNRFPKFAFNARIQRLTEGSVVVSFKIDVVSRTDGGDVINSDNILNAILDNLDNELGYLFGKFLVPPASIIINREETISQNIMNRDDQNETNDLEHQLETYEEEIFSKPRLETITDLVFGKTTNNYEVSITTGELGRGDEATPSELNDPNLIEFVTTATLAESDSQTESATERWPAADNVEIITTVFESTLATVSQSTITDESPDNDKLDDWVDSQTGIYDLSEISVESRTEYYEAETERSIEDMELVKFQNTNDELDNEEANTLKYDVTTDNISLELNTFQTNIENF